MKEIVFKKSCGGVRVKLALCFYVFALCVPQPADAFLFTRSFSDDFGPVIGRPLDCVSVVFWGDCFDSGKNKKHKRKYKKKVYRPLTEREAQAAVRQYMPALKKPDRTIKDSRIR